VRDQPSHPARVRLPRRLGASAAQLGPLWWVAHHRAHHRQGSGDASRNNARLGVVTLGDGWHHNHHRFPTSARHGLAPGEIDPSWLALRLLAGLGLVWDLRGPPAAARRDR
jgi:stearoyl-CoA desaturase (delta-9 desaturase)